MAHNMHLYRPRRRIRLSVGVIVFFICLLASGAPIGYRLIRNNRARALYERARLSFLQGDCDSALVDYATVLDIGLDDYVDAVEPEYGICQEFVRIRQTPTERDAMIDYLSFVRIRVNNALLIEKAIDEAASLFDRARPAALVSDPLCEDLSHWVEEGVVPHEHLPDTLMACGDMYAREGNEAAAFDTYLQLIQDYPDHNTAHQAADMLAESELACDMMDELLASPPTSTLLNTADLLHDCGQRAAVRGDYREAVVYYQDFLANFPSDARVAAVEAALATAMIQAARAAGAGFLAAPQPRGLTLGGNAVIIIQNDSPERLRLILSGPETRIEDLEACVGCETYAGTGPAFCPEQGPIGTYELPLGVYDVLVLSISDNGRTPFTGTWDLNEASEYYSCFFLVHASD